MDIFSPLVSLIENYGWYMLLFGIVFVYFYQNVLKSHIETYKKQRDQEEYSAKYHKNPDLFVARQVAQQEAAMKLQEKYKKDAEAYQKKLEEREAKKRNELIEKHQEQGGGGGYKLGSSSDRTGSFKPEYNPLTGSGGGSTYRAPRRTPCGGGGCG